MNNIDRDFDDLMESVANEGLLVEFEHANEGVVDKIKSKVKEVQENAGLPYPEVVEILKKKIENDKKSIYITDKELMPTVDKHILAMQKVHEDEGFKTKIYTVAGVKVLFIFNKVKTNLIINTYYPYKTITNKCDLRITTYKGEKKKVATESMLEADDEYIDDVYEDIAEEGLFNKDKSTDDVVASYGKKINKLASVEACDKFLEMLREESGKFNTALSSLAKANKDFSSGKITKDELKNIVKPHVELLKKQCEILNIRKFGVDVKNVTSEDLKKVKEVISGLIKLTSARKAELKKGSKAAESTIPNEEEIDKAFEELMIDSETIDAATESEDLVVDTEDDIVKELGSIIE